MKINLNIQKLKLKRLMNTRDLGGLPTADGRHIKYAKLIRSGGLRKLPKRSAMALRQIGVSKIVDLRTTMECEESPCDVWEGCEYVNLPLLCASAVGITREENMRKLFREEGKRIKKEYGSVDNYMINMYRENVLLPETQQRLAEFMRLAVDNEGCMLFCCTAGKDRTGICAMLLETALGVNRETVIHDYQISYHFQHWKRDFQKIGLWILPMPPSYRSILIATMNAKRKYIMAAFEAIEENYGSMDGYFKNVLHLTEEDLQTLKDKYLE